MGTTEPERSADPKQSRESEPPVRDRDDPDKIPDELPGYTPQARTGDHGDDPDDLSRRGPSYTPDGDLGT
jgi:hypothetical protein